MAVGGWADGYTNAVFRLLEHLRVPRLGLVGALGPSTITATGTTTFPPCGVKPAPRFRRGHWSVLTRTRTVMTSDADNFYVWAERDAWEDDKRVFTKNWDLEFPRDYL